MSLTKIKWAIVFLSSSGQGEHVPQHVSVSKMMPNRIMAAEKNPAKTETNEQFDILELEWVQRVEII